MTNSDWAKNGIVAFLSDNANVFTENFLCPHLWKRYLSSICHGYYLYIVQISCLSVYPGLMKYLIKPRDVELSFVIALTTLFNVRTCQGAPVVIVPWADCRPSKLEKYPQTIWIICECKLSVDYCGGYLNALLLIVLRIPVRNSSWFGGGTRATFETPKYPRRPRDQYTAPNSKYIGAECSAPAPYRGKPPPPPPPPPPPHTHTHTPSTHLPTK